MDDETDKERAQNNAWTYKKHSDYDDRERRLPDTKSYELLRLCFPILGEKLLFTMHYIHHVYASIINLEFNWQTYKVSLH